RRGGSRGGAFVEEAALDFARQHPDVVFYINPRSCPAPMLLAEYLNGTVREELIASKTSEEILQLATKLAGQSGLDIIRIRKPFHTKNPSIQGQWHPLTNKPSTLTIQGPPAFHLGTRAAAPGRLGTWAPCLGSFSHRIVLSRRGNPGEGADMGEQAGAGSH
uniref:Large ribosomal subunit protein mL43 n=1 Tax=Athene cunicularia TaxID=194338 RepID=A0A663MH11_ATHCN